MLKQLHLHMKLRPTIYYIGVEIIKKNINSELIQSHHLKIIDFSKNVITDFNLSPKAKECFS